VYETAPESLGISGASEALLRAGEIGLALKHSYVWLGNNPYDVSAYAYIRDISVKYGSRLSLGSFLLSRKGYSELQTSSGVNLRLGSFTASVSANHKKPLSKEENLIKRAPEGASLRLISSIDLGRARVGFVVGLLRRNEEVLSLGLFGELNSLSEFSIRTSLFTNKETEETLYLYIGGVKDSLRVSSEVSLSKSLFVTGEFEYSKFYTLKRENLRNLYPDYSFRLYSQLGRFSSADYSGDMEGVLPSPGFQIIPQNYESFGVGFSFGYENRDSYVRVWRPFLDLEFGYNTRYGVLSSATAGLGGALLDRDNVALYVSLSENRGPTQETIFRAGVTYNRWF